MNEKWRRHLRTALLLLGVSLLAYSIYKTGPLTILNTAKGALPFLPLIMLFNVGFYVLEALGHRQMLGAHARRAVPISAFVRAMLSGFVTSLLFPLGRAGAEVVRASVLAPYVGTPRASAASAAFQIPAMYGIGILGVAILGAAFFSLGALNPLTLAVLVHCLVCLGFATLMLVMTRNVAVGNTLLRRFPRLTEGAKAFDKAIKSPSEDYLVGTGYCVLARVSELSQYAVVLLALSVPLSPVKALLANGIHVVGSTAGEFIPGQIGTVESSYLYFAPALGLADSSARAVSIALLVRVAQYTEAAVAFVMLQLWPEPAPSEIAE